MTIDGKLGCLLRGMHALLIVAGAAMLVSVCLAVCGLPGGLGAWIAAQAWNTGGVPDYVVVLGGGGIPSESGLVRTYYAAERGREWTNAVFVVALTAEGDVEASSAGRMRDELVLRGISRSAIRLETRGRNTHEQAAQTRRLLGDEALNRRLCIVSSPTHLRRAALCFRKEGFTRVATLGARSVGVEANLGPGQALRYRFWANLEYQVRVMREVCALAYYRLRGWV